MLRSPLVFALVTVLVAAVPFTVHVAHRLGGNITGIYFVTADYYRTLGFDRWYPPGTILLRNGPYDGQFFLAFANDPLLRAALDTEKGRATRFYRGRRMMWPWAGWLLAAGSAKAIPTTLVVSELLLLCVAAYALGRVAISTGRHPAWVVLLGLSLGTSVSLLRGVADLFATELLLLGCCAWHFRRYFSSAILFAAAALAKEYTALVPFVLGVASLARAPAAPRLRDASWLLAVPAAMAAWWGYLLLTGPGHSVGNRNVGLPLAGILEYFRHAAPLWWEPFCFAMTLVALVVAVVAGRASWSAMRFAALGLVALALVTNYAVWIEAWAYGRIHMTIPCLLLFTGLRERRIDLAAPLAAAAAGIVIWAYHI